MAAPLPGLSCAARRAVRQCAAPSRWHRAGGTERTVLGAEGRGPAAAQPTLLQAAGTALGAQRGAGPRNAARSRRPGPTRRLVHLRACPNEKSRRTGLASSRRLPEPPNACSSGRRRGGRVAERAGDGRERIGVSSVSTWASFRVPRGNVSRNPSDLLAASSCPAAPHWPSRSRRDRPQRQHAARAPQS